jgi:para-aminobenzoate synthetase component 1
MVCILRICFLQPKIFLLRGNELEIQYLTMCEEDIDEDLDEINLQSEDHESKVVSVEIKQNFKRKVPR